MKSLEAFQTFYEQELKPQLAAHDMVVRQAIKAALKVVGWCLLLGGVALGACMILQAPEYYAGCLGGAVVVAIIAATISYSRHAQNQHLTHYKQQIIMPIIDFLFDGALTYHPTSGISRNHVDDTQLLPDFDEFSSEDLVTGTLDKTEIAYSEIKAVSVRHVKTKNGSRTERETIFEGWMLVADFNKKFRGYTMVLPDGWQGLLGQWAHVFQKFGGISGTELVKLEDVAFEKAYRVYGTDQIEARYLLTPLMMETFVALYKRYGAGVRAALHRGTLNLMLPSVHDRLEAPSRNWRWEDWEHAQRIYVELWEPFKMIEDLQLNTRIWTKE